MGLFATTQARAGRATEQDIYKLIVFNRAGTAMLMEARNSGYGLPVFEIPRFTRSAKEITSILRDRLRTPSVLLFSGLLKEDPHPVYFAALEAQGRITTPPKMDWFPVHHAILHLLKHEERDALETSYLKALNRPTGDDPEPFSRLGWMSNLQDWVRTVIHPLGMELKDFQQLNGCETFSLIRFDTTHRPVWFKAVGDPNRHEFLITLAISELFPEYVPCLLASQPAWHGWLTADANGSSLDESENPSAWKSAVTALAALQVQSIGRTKELLEAGCKDLSISKLLALVDPFLDLMADLMKQQRKIPPATLSREELSELSATLKDTLHCLAALRIPDTLGHSDFNPGNIIVGPERCVFIDWAEAYVGHPFLTFEYFLAHLRKDYPQFVPFESDLRASYSQIWNSIASPEQVAETYLFSPLVAVYAYAVSSGVWRDRERLKVPGFQAYLRSLTRRMKQEADLLQRRRVECPN